MHQYAAVVELAHAQGGAAIVVRRAARYPAIRAGLPHELKPGEQLINAQSELLPISCASVELPRERLKRSGGRAEHPSEFVGA